mmetsp:Transcript_43374/g.69502  ORF Transcript_43374/g.69502 Transcript_43374/m.69502 type:complete len:270 (+) Transcript_43374:68-877(+)
MESTANHWHRNDQTLQHQRQVPDTYSFDETSAGQCTAGRQTAIARSRRLDCIAVLIASAFHGSASFCDQNRSAAKARTHSPYSGYRRSRTDHCIARSKTHDRNGTHQQSRNRGRRLCLFAQHQTVPRESRQRLLKQQQSQREVASHSAWIRHLCTISTAKIRRALWTHARALCHGSSIDEPVCRQTSSLFDVRQTAAYIGRHFELQTSVSDYQSIGVCASCRWSSRSHRGEYWLCKECSYAAARCRGVGHGRWRSFGTIVSAIGCGEYR